MEEFLISESRERNRKERMKRSWKMKGAKMEFDRDFFYDEVQDGFYVPGIMKRAWAVQLELLSEIDRICKKRNLSYFIAYGTLLGAVRNRGFIPWDDDIDIVMLRKDYEKFFQVAKDELAEGIQIISMEEDDTLCSFLNGIGRKWALSKEALEKVHGFPYPHAVDIFPLDELSDNPEDEGFRRNVLDMLSLMISAINDNQEDTEIFQNALLRIEELLQITLDRKESLERQLYQLLNRIFQEFNGEGGEKLCFFRKYWTDDISYPKSAFEKAKSELQAKGVSFPIHLDVPVEQTDVVAVQQTNSLKQSIEETLGTENVIVDVLQMTDNEKESITSQAKVPTQKDYDLNGTGWGPDYQDPATYLNILDAKKGSALKHLGITKGKDPEVMAKVGLDEYKKLLDEAASETTNLDKRYEKYAKAQAWVTDSSLLIPVASSGGSPMVSRAVPFTKAYSQVGIKGDPFIFKGMELQNDIVTTKEYEAALKKWQKEKLESNAQYQKNLEKHVK